VDVRRTADESSSSLCDGVRSWIPARQSPSVLHLCRYQLHHVPVVFRFSFKMLYKCYSCCWRLSLWLLDKLCLSALLHCWFDPVCKKHCSSKYGDWGTTGLVNLLIGTANYSTTSNNMKLVHWPLTGWLLHLVILLCQAGRARCRPGTKHYWTLNIGHWLKIL